MSNDLIKEFVCTTNFYKGIFMFTQIGLVNMSMCVCVFVHALVSQIVSNICRRNPEDNKSNYVQRLYSCQGLLRF